MRSRLGLKIKMFVLECRTRFISSGCILREDEAVSIGFMIVVHSQD